MATISIIIPSYNAESLILKTIDSVQKQTFSDWELIIIDDGSTDKTVSKIKTIKDERIHLFCYENGGVAMARNRGISLAKGKFISFLDCDDLWTKDKLKDQLSALKNNPDADVAYSWVIDFFTDIPNSSKPRKPIFFSGNVYPQMLVYNFLANGSNILVRRETVERIGGFDVTYNPSEDWNFYIRLAKECSFVLVPKHQILYRQSTTSMSSNNIQKLEKGGLLVIENAYESAPSHLQYLKRKSLALFYEYCAQRYLQSSIDRSYAQQIVLKLRDAIALYPPVLGTKFFYGLVYRLSKHWLLRVTKKTIAKL